jgi:hypothetical protein
MKRWAYTAASVGFAAGCYAAAQAGIELLSALACVLTVIYAFHASDAWRAARRGTEQ